MKVSEAMGNADTPTPVRVEHEFNLMDAHGYSLTGYQSNTHSTHTRNKTNAALLAHWYNHGPKLMEAWCKSVEIWQKQNPSIPTAFLPMALALDAASEVEGL